VINKILSIIAIISLIVLILAMIPDFGFPGWIKYVAFGVFGGLALTVNIRHHVR